MTSSYGPIDFQRDTDVSRETLDKLVIYADALQKWQKAKNLVANSTLDDRWRRHFLDSAQMFKPMREVFGEKKLTLLDIGSGAGFPGLVLSIMGLGKATMVESNGRKCTFMNQVARQTVANAVICNKRIESAEISEPIDVVVSRACAKISQLLEWASPFLQSNVEMWLLKGEGVDEELTQAQASWNMKVERFSSQTSETGVILRLYNIKRR